MDPFVDAGSVSEPLQHGPQIGGFEWLAFEGAEEGGTTADTEFVTPA
jgi:hypothetical protein